MDISFPKTIFFIVNSKCNLSCRMCDVGQNNKSGMFHKVMVPDKKTRLPVSKLEEILDEVMEWNPAISVTSTEPLLYKPLYQLIEAVKRRNLQFNLTTNGYLLPENAEKLVNAGIDQLWVSIDGPPDLHDTIRGKAGLSVCLANGLKRIFELKDKGMKPEVFINFTITDLNYGHLCETLKYFEDQQWLINSVVFSHLNFVTKEMAKRHNALYANSYPASCSCVSSVDHSSIDLDILFDQLEKVKKQSRFKTLFSPSLDRKGLDVFYKKHDKPVSSPGCKALLNFVQILADGNVTGSTRCFNISLGNIYNQSLTGIWNGSKRRKMINDLNENGLFPACLRCCGAF